MVLRPWYYNFTKKNKKKKHSITIVSIQKPLYYCSKCPKPLDYNCTCAENHSITVVNVLKPWYYLATPVTTVYYGIYSVKLYNIVIFKLLQ